MNEPRRFWEDMARPAATSVLVGGTVISRGSRVRLRPHSGADAIDTRLAGRLATVDGVEEDQDGRVHLALVVDTDPGRDLGADRQPGHRFFFGPEEVEPIEGVEGAPGPRILVAGIGNVFLGDDGFGVEVVHRIRPGAFPPGVDVVDFGIRGIDLVHALGRDYSAAVLIDASPRGEPPGTLTVVEIEPPRDAAEVVDAHGMDPVHVLRIAARLGTLPPRILVVACEPQEIPRGDADVLAVLSPPVREAIEPAVALVESVVSELLAAAVEASPPGGTPS